MSKKEIWKRVQFKGKKPSVAYAVSNKGRFGVELENGKIEVREFLPQKGGFRYNFKIDGASRSIFVYKEVAKAFVNKPSPKHNMVIRVDHNYLNDHPNNLKWVTKEEHRRHVINSPQAIEARRSKAIVKSFTAKVFDEKTVREVKKIIWDPKRKLTFKQIAERFNVSEMQIYRIKSGELWFHVKVENEPVHKKFVLNQKNIERLGKRKSKSDSKKNIKSSGKKSKRK